MNQSPQTLERLELYRAVPSSKAQYRPLQGTMGAPPTPSSPVSAKRKSEEISREYSPSPDAKRVKVKSEADASGAIADLPEINHPTSSLPQLPPSNAHASLSSSSADNASVQVQRSAKFWYPDGNVVVRVDACLFKLHRSRLAQYCLYFAKLFEGAEENPSYYEQVDGCAVFHVPSDLKVDDFERLLAALDTPLIYMNAPPTQSVTLSLLRASHSLSCDLVLNMAKERLCASWDAYHPPKAPSFKKRSQSNTRAASCSSSTPGADAEPGRTYAEAIYIVHVARQYHVPALLKRAFYELLASETFWKALVADRKQIKLPEDDLLRLYNARYVLEQRWREAAVISPWTEERDGRGARHSDTYMCFAQSGYMSETWRRLVLEAGLVEEGTRDPMRYELLGKLDEGQRKLWCPWCLARWEDRLTRRRAEWWALLDGLLGLQ